MMTWTHGTKVHEEVQNLNVDQQLNITGDVFCFCKLIRAAANISDQVSPQLLVIFPLNAQYLDAMGLSIKSVTTDRVWWGRGIVGVLVFTTVASLLNKTGKKFLNKAVSCWRSVFLRCCSVDAGRPGGADPRAAANANSACFSDVRSRRQVTKIKYRVKSYQDLKSTVKMWQTDTTLTHVQRWSHWQATKWNAALPWIKLQYTNQQHI